jgi:hypothetical protein
MSTFNRIAAWIIIVISIIGILVCLAGVVGSWAVNARLTDGILRLLSVVQAQLTSVEGALTRAGDQLQTASAALQTVQEAGSKLGNSIEENTPLLDLISSTLDENLVPSVESVRELFRPVWDSVLAINNTLEALNALPGIELPTLTEQLQALSDRIEQVLQAARQLQTSIVEFRTGVVQNLLDPFLARVEEISNGLTVLEENVQTYLGQVDLLQAAVADLEARVPRTIDALTVILTLVLIWSALAQISLILLARLYLKTGKMAWEFAPHRAQDEEIAFDPGP